MESTFLKVNRRGGFLNRRVVINESTKTLEYHRYRKKFTLHRSSYYEIADISDVREGWNTQKFKKIEEKERRKWMKGQRGPENWVREECSFSICFGNHKSIDLIAADSIERQHWLNKLKYLMFEAKTFKKTKDRRNFIEKCFKEADKDGDKCVDFMEALGILNRLNISISHELAKELFHKAIVISKPKNGAEVVDLDEFIVFFESLENRWEVEELFRKYAKPGGTIMGPDELQNFLTQEQNMTVTLDDCQKYIEKFQTSWYASLSTHLLEASQRNPVSSMILEKYMNPKGLSISFEDALRSEASFQEINRIHRMHCKLFGHSFDLNNCFEAMLLSQEFDLFNHGHYKINQDMNKSLNHYYILSSHNTYLLAGQLVGDSSIEGYIHALKQGYRCIELDIWDGDEDDGPIVYHGYTMVSKLLLRNVLEAIGAYAFDTTPYPLILSLEVNCSHEQQKTVAALLVAILGDKLYKRPLLPNERQLPSPEHLKNKILIKAKGPQSRADEDYSSSSSSDEEELNETRKYITNRRYSMPVFTKSAKCLGSKRRSVSYSELEKFPPNNLNIHSKGLIPNLSDLAIYCTSRKFRNLEDTLTWRFNEMFSLNETESADLAHFHQEQYMACTARRLVRIYPKGSRINSSNFDPSIHWNVGCQMVALNIQTLGKHLLLNEAKFKTNGRCGYAIKPVYLIRPNPKHDKVDRGKRLELTIISAQQIPKAPSASDDDIVDPYVKISIIGHPDDRQKMVTEVVKNNGFNPIWSQTFVFNIKYPELAFIYFKCKDERISGKDAKLAANVIAVESMSPGYRHFQLLDNAGKKIDGCTIFLKFNIS